MPRKKQNDSVPEYFKLYVAARIKKFIGDETQEVLEFPNCLSSQDRQYVHNYCRGFQLKTKSKGKNVRRLLNVFKVAVNKSVNIHDASLNLTEPARHHIVHLLQNHPVTTKEKLDLAPVTEQNSALINPFVRDVKSTGCLGGVIPQVPPPRPRPDDSTLNLPVFQARSEIVHAINTNRVILIYGDTGTGKTTQVPQFILDKSHDNHTPCRILCTQPRRLATSAVAERISNERNEKLGQTVGYQIRLESRISPRTLLTFCTNGVLLRTLMSSDKILSGVTHIIIDEVHEREKFCDFLLIVLRDVLPRYPHLKLILMSATLDTDLFTKYFNSCPIIYIECKMYEVTEFYLEDVLRITGYTNVEMISNKEEVMKLIDQKQSLNNWCSITSESKTILQSSDDLGQDDDDVIVEESPDQSFGSSSNPTTKTLFVDEKCEIDKNMINLIDCTLSDAWLKGNPDSMTHMLRVIMENNISVDYQHSETSATPLMIAAGRGCLNSVEQLLGLGADVSIRALNKWTAIDWATNFGHAEISELLQIHLNYEDETSADIDTDIPSADKDKIKLSLYQHCVNEDKHINYDLILCLLDHIHNCRPEGAVLVFLPGYADIAEVHAMILSGKFGFANSSNFVLYTLHSNIQTSDQKKVFLNPPRGVRKIILSTNVAETSITISDVIYVIDCGKVKEKSFDALHNVTLLQPVWISRASAKQRKGRAGRCQPGFVFRLFSKERFDHMTEYQIPELLRAPLQEICLQAKAFAPPNVSVAEFLVKAPEPPSPVVTRNAVSLLKSIDAMDPNEGLTELGQHLLDLPIDPTLGKMVLYSVVLKCLDPILTIVCSLSYRDPFVIPSIAVNRRAAKQIRKKFAANADSDHMVLLRTFQAWQKAQSEGCEKSFCRENFISGATMEMIMCMRTKLLGQLRASGFVHARGNGDIRNLNTNSENWAVVKVALFVGVYPNVARVNKTGNKLITRKVKTAKFHPSSTLNCSVESANQNMEKMYRKVVKNLRSDWLFYDEMTMTGHLSFIRCCSAITPISVALFGGPAKLISADEDEHQNNLMDEDCLIESSDSEVDDNNEDQKRSVLKIDDWISFQLNSEAKRLILQVRQKWHSLFLRRMKLPMKAWSPMDEAIIMCVVNVLTNQELNCGLNQPIGIGQRPKPMSIDFLCNSPAGYSGAGENPASSRYSGAGENPASSRYSGAGENPASSRYSGAGKNPASSRHASSLTYSSHRRSSLYNYGNQQGHQRNDTLQDQFDNSFGQNSFRYGNFNNGNHQTIHQHQTARGNVRGRPIRGQNRQL